MANSERVPIPLTFRCIYVPGACSACGATREPAGAEPLLHCGGCKHASYCSKECQLWAWKGVPPPFRGVAPVHKVVCAALAAANAAVDDGPMDLKHNAITFERPKELIALMQMVEKKLESAKDEGKPVGHVVLFKGQPTASVASLREWFAQNGQQFGAAPLSVGLLGMAKDTGRRVIVDHILQQGGVSLDIARAAVYHGTRQCAICYTTEGVQFCNDCHSVCLCAKHQTDELHMSICSMLAGRFAVFVQQQDIFGPKATGRGASLLMATPLPSGPVDVPDTWDAYFRLAAPAHAQRVMTTNSAAYPMTILSGLKQAGLLGKKKLTLHVLGTTNNAELKVTVDYAAHFQTFLPNTNIEMVCIGPSLQKSCVFLTTPKLTISLVKDVYEDTRLPTADAVFIFDGGLSFTYWATTGSQSWVTTLAKLAQQKVPVLCTARSEAEAQADVAYLKEIGFLVTREASPNPFKNLLGNLPHNNSLCLVDADNYLRKKWSHQGIAVAVFGFQGLA